MKKILIVDDHAEIRRLVRMTLEFEDWETYESTDAAKGWDMALAVHPDLVLLDVKMPGEQDGLDMCRAIQCHSRLRDVPVIILSALGSTCDREAGIRAGATAYLIKPFSPMQLLSLVGELLAPSESPPNTALTDLCTRTESTCPSADENDQMERLIADLGVIYRERKVALQEIAHAHHDALLRLSRAAEFSDSGTGAHIVRVGYLAWALALRMDEKPEFAMLLRLAAPLHDIGKIGIQASVLEKPGSLTPEERVVMNRHPQIGAEILGRSRVPLVTAVEVALTHHERWDGCGYPRGLAGESIPLSGRIVSVVDFFDALTMDRCYRPAFSDHVALDMLVEQRGLTFDPRVVDTFLNHSTDLIALRDQVNRRKLDFEDLCSGSDPFFNTVD